MHDLQDVTQRDRMLSNEHVEDFLSKSNVMVFRPTMEEFKDFSKYVQYMEECGAAKWGIAKIIPPKGWKPCRNLEKNLNIKQRMIENPILQEISSTHSGIYQQMNIEQSPLSVEDYKKEAESDRYKPPEGSLEFIEQRYWRGLTFNPPLYGADVQGSLYDKDVKEWNVPHLGDVLEEVCKRLNVRIPGVNSPYLYFGMWRTTFPWHVEDMDLHSINYLHYGEPKFWYAIPECHASRFETMLRGIYPDFFKVCPQFLRHKMTIVSPKNLARNGIPVNRMIQRAGEFMITFPHGYHSGFNMGYNAAESVNFALHRWVHLGKVSKFCVCYSDTVSINMDDFIDEYNALYEMDVQKVVRKEPPPRKTIVTAQNNEILTKMRARVRRTRQVEPRRRLVDYRSENNRTAIRRRIRYRNKMNFKKRKLKKWKSQKLLKKCLKRACCRDLIIDPLPDLDCEIRMDSDAEEERRPVTRLNANPYNQPRSVRILSTGVDTRKYSDFPHKSWFSKAMSAIEKDFTLRGENVPLRTVYVRPRINSGQAISEGSNGPFEATSSAPSESSSEPKIKSEPEEAEEPKIFIQNVYHDVKVHDKPKTRDVSDQPRSKTQVSTEVNSDLKPDLEVNSGAQPVIKPKIKSSEQKSAEPEKTKRKRKKKGPEISLDIPDSFNLDPPSSESRSNSGKDMPDFYDILEKIKLPPPTVNRRKTRKNKGGRPNKVLQRSLERTEEEKLEAMREEEFGPKKRTKGWEPTAHLHMPAVAIPAIEHDDVYHVTVESTEETLRKTSSLPCFDDGNDIGEQDEDSQKSDWRLCIMHKVKEESNRYQKQTRKRRYLHRLRMKPTFGTRGPSLSQDKINAIIEAESSVRIKNLKGKRINVKLKDMIIFDKKIIASNVENRDKNGRLRVNKCSAYSGFESMLRITWMFDHTYSTPNTLLSPENVVTVPIGDSRFKVIHVDINNQTTKSYTGRSFVNQHTKWSPRILSMGHNIMAIFNYQSYSGTGFMFDDTAEHPQPSIVRHVSTSLCQKILDQRQHILKHRHNRKTAEFFRKLRKQGKSRLEIEELLSQRKGAREDTKQDGCHNQPYLEEVQGDFGTSSQLSSPLSGPLSPPLPPQSSTLHIAYPSSQHSHHHPSQVPSDHLISQTSHQPTSRTTSQPTQIITIHPKHQLIHRPSLEPIPVVSMQLSQQPSINLSQHSTSNPTQHTAQHPSQSSTRPVLDFNSSAGADKSAPRNLFSSPRLQIKIKSVQSVTPEVPGPTATELLVPGRPQADGNVACHQDVRTSVPEKQVISLDQFNFPPPPNKRRAAQRSTSAKNKKLAMYEFREPDPPLPGSNQFCNDLNKGGLLNHLANQLSFHNPSSKYSYVRDGERPTLTSNASGTINGIVQQSLSIPLMSPVVQPDQATKIRRYLESALVNNEGLGDAVFHRNHDLYSTPVSTHPQNSTVTATKRGNSSKEKPCSAPLKTRLVHERNDVKQQVPSSSLSSDHARNLQRDGRRMLSRDPGIIPPKDGKRSLPPDDPASVWNWKDETKDILSEEHIQWCLKTNNVDDFRIWDAANNLKAYMPPSERAPDAVAAKFEQKPNKSSENVDLIIDSLENIRTICAPTSAQRREEWRKIREQKLAGKSINSQDDEVQEIATIYNPPGSLDPSLGVNKRTFKNKVVASSFPFVQEPSSSSSIPLVAAPLPGLMPNPDSADFQLYRSNFEKSR